MRIVLDAWPLVAMMKGQPAADRVLALVDEHDAHMSAVNLGEAYYALIRSHGDRIARDRVERMRDVITVEDPDWPLVRAAAELKARGGLSYADAFCVATAMRHNAPLYTGDPEITRLEADVEVIDLRSSS